MSGLTAAYLLTRQGKRVTMYAPETLGGMLLTRKQGGFTLEQGPNVILEKPELKQLIDQLGIRDQVVYPLDDNYRQFVWHAGAPCQVPRAPLLFLKSKLFSLREKVTILRALFKPGVFLPEAADESVLTFFSRGLGSTIVYRVLDPVLKGIYGGQVRDLSAAAIFPQLWESMTRGRSLIGFLKERRTRGVARPKTFVFRRGMESLIEALRQAAGTKLTHRKTLVTSIAFSAGNYRIVDSGGDVCEAPQLVLALPLRLAVPLISLDSVGDDLKIIQQLVNNRRYAPLAVIHCSSRQAPSFAENSFGILFPEGTPDFFLGAMFNSQIFPHLAPTGEHLITLCFGGISAAGKDDALKPSDALVKGLCLQFLGLADVSIMARHLWQGAIPQYDMQHRELELALSEFEIKYPGLVFASADRGGVGVSDRIKSVVELIGNEH